MSETELRSLAKQLDDARIAAPDFRGYRPSLLERASRPRTFSDRDDYRLLFHWAQSDSPFPDSEKIVAADSQNSRGEDLPELRGTNLTPALQFQYHFAAWLTQPEYRCRLPIQAEWFVSQFGENPTQSHCPKTYSFPLSSEFGNSIDIDPDRVFEIQYVHAGVGDAVESRFGHAMFRIVQCAPHRTHLSEDCRRDKAFQIILSFRARTGGKAPGILDGMTGTYPMELGSLRPSEVQDTYLETELRSIEWLPLKMNHYQIRRFTQRASEIAWSIEGDYAFLTRNCADDALRLLAVALNDTNRIPPRADILTPSGLREFLIEQGIADRTQALKSKPSDESLKVFYRRLTRSTAAALNGVSLREYLLNSKAEARSSLLQNLLRDIELARKTDDLERESQIRLALESWLIIEPYCRRVIERELIAAWAQENKSRILEAAEKYEQVRLRERLDAGYGIARDPRGTRAAHMREEIVATETLELARDWLRKNHPEKFQEVETSLQALTQGQDQLLGLSLAQFKKNAKGNP